MMGNLVIAVISAKTAVVREQIIELSNYLRFRCSWSKCQRKIIECAFHVKNWAKGFATHPQHSGTAVIRKHLTASNLINVLRRECEADDLQLLPFAVDYGRNRASRFKLVCVCKCRAGENLICMTRLDIAALLDVQVIQHRNVLIRYRNDSPPGGLFETWNVKSHISNDAKFGLCYPRNFVHACCE